MPECTFSPNETIYSHRPKVMMDYLNLFSLELSINQEVAL